MPHKANAARRHCIPQPKRRVTNWSEYNDALRQRGSLTVWFTDEAIAAWKAAPRTTPGGQPHYGIVKLLGGSRELDALDGERAGGGYFRRLGNSPKALHSNFSQTNDPSPA